MLGSLFKKKKQFEGLITEVDVHSHLLPGIDDGVDSIESAIEVIKGFENLGYKKLITTPHIMFDFYKNNPEIITSKLNEVKAAMLDNGIGLELEAAAEYYLDEYFMELIDTDAPLLTFGDNYILFELSFVSKPLTIKDAIFKLLTKGYKPVLAHPERYLYFQRSYSDLLDLKDSGVLLQLNLLSVSGYYSKPVKQLAEKLINDKKIDLIGSDCHSAQQLMALSNTLDSATMNQLLNLNLLNNSL